MDPARYDRVAIALHWAIGLALLAQIAFGFSLDAIAPRGTPLRAPVINLHKSTGMILGLLIAARLVWRLRHAPPPWPEGVPAWRRRAATLGHRALYACMLVMPLSGYIASNFSKYGVLFFGIALNPWGPELPEVYAVFNGIHVATAWLLTALVAGHVLVALRDLWIDRDGVAGRMWPAPTGAADRPSHGPRRIIAAPLDRLTRAGRGTRP
jgi:cytochrome b561